MMISQQELLKRVVGVALVVAVSSGCGKLKFFNRSGGEDDGQPTNSPTLTEETGHHDGEHGDQGNRRNDPQGGQQQRQVENGGGGPVVVTDPIIVPPVPAPHPDPALVSLADIQFAGTACVGGQGGVVAFGADLATLELTLPDEVAGQVGPGVSIRESRKQCSILLSVLAPGGWSYRLKNVSLVASVDLEDGVESVVGVQAYFQGSAVTAQYELTQEGPLVGDQTVTGLLETEWVPVGAAQRALVLKVESRVGRLARASATSKGLGLARQALIYSVEWVPPQPVP